MSVSSDVTNSPQVSAGTSPIIAVNSTSIREAVLKDSSTRLRQELVRSQKYLFEDEVGDLSRDQLVKVVCSLREFAGTTTSVKTMTTFKPSLSLSAAGVGTPEPVGTKQEEHTSVIAMC